VSRDVNSSIGERSQEFPQIDDQAFPASSGLLKSFDERRYDLLEGLVDDSKTVSVIALKNVCAHEREDWHDVLHELIGNERTELSEEEERLRVGLRVDRGCRFGNDSVSSRNSEKR